MFFRLHSKVAYVHVQARINGKYSGGREGGLGVYRKKLANLVSLLKKIVQLKLIQSPESSNISTRMGFGVSGVGVGFWCFSIS